MREKRDGRRQFGRFQSRPNHNVLNETEKDDLETRLFECGVPMKTLYDVNESVFEESRRRD